MVALAKRILGDDAADELAVDLAAAIRAEVDVIVVYDDRDRKSGLPGFTVLYSPKQCPFGGRCKLVVSSAQ
eukprot:scaffold84121_cov105-Phaeocystis_antarctica.AAC.1